MVPKKNLAKSLKKRRNEKKLSQKEVASEANVTPSQLSKIENNRGNPTHETIYRVWEAVESLNKDYDVATEVMISEKDIYWADVDDTIEELSRVMYENDYSQLPVGNPDEIKGTITDQEVMKASSEDTAGDVMVTQFPVLEHDTKLHVIRAHLAEYKAVLVREKGKIIGMITPFDVLKHRHGI